MRLPLAAALLVLLSGCETCRNHPVACGASMGILATSIALSANHGDSNRQPKTGAAIGPGPSCTPQPNGSCR